MNRFFLLAFLFCLTCCGVDVSNDFGDADGPHASSSASSSNSDGTGASSPTNSGGAPSTGDASGGAPSAGGSDSVTPTTTAASTGTSAAGAGGSGGAGSGGRDSTAGEGGASRCLCSQLLTCAQDNCPAECPDAMPSPVYPFITSDRWPDVCTPCLEGNCRCELNACVEAP